MKVIHYPPLLRVPQQHPATATLPCSEWNTDESFFWQNSEENLELISLVTTEASRSLYEPYSYWIGAEDRDKEDQWVDSNTGLPLAYKNFQSGQPDDYGTDGEDCVVLISWGSWNDFSCGSAAHGYLCEFFVEYIHT
ncbi:Collectin-12 [Portunus trituberculatus]|uniref:Collectin-12 n=1 Tax=Portunus trituberculatus TaxID=210409 RepID=A0A5B7IHL1_PORTR|nr:Collectin-12 [Portunus trituberculatus]